ncbi:MAG: type II secretion system protein [bacterium]|nr:type II secretion system protein [bacterium]
MDSKISCIKRRKKLIGFTLIELLVVISIIGLLAAIVLIGVKAVRSKAQDVQTKADVASISRSLEAYAAENDENYPISRGLATGYCGTEKLGGDTPSGDAEAMLKSSITTMPRPATSYAVGNYYLYQGCGQTYTLRGMLRDSSQYVSKGDGTTSTTSASATIDTTAPNISMLSSIYPARRMNPRGETSSWVVDMSPQVSNPTDIAQYIITVSGGTGKTAIVTGTPYSTVNWPSECQDCGGVVQIPFTTWRDFTESIPVDGLYCFSYIKVQAFDEWGNYSFKSASPYCEI